MVLDMADSFPDGLARAAERACRWLTIAVITLTLVLIVERLGYARVYDGNATAAGLAVQLVFALPAIIQLAALWQLRSAAAAVAAGLPFGSAVVGGLTRTGACLIVASIASFAMPPAHYLLDAAYPRSIDLDVAVAIMAAIGGGLIFLARLVRRAAAVETELDAIF